MLPLSRNEELSPKARDLAAELRKNWNIEFDDAGAIGRRYRRQDEIGTRSASRSTSTLSRTRPSPCATAMP